jgi:hypothetical protein
VVVRGQVVGERGRRAGAGARADADADADADAELVFNLATSARKFRRRARDACNA